MAPVESIPNFYIFNEVAERLRMAAAAELAEGNHIATAAAEVPESEPAEPDVEADESAVTESENAEPAAADSETETTEPEPDTAQADQDQPAEPAIRRAEPIVSPTITPESDDFAAVVESALSAAESDHVAQLSTSSGDPRNA